MSNNKLTISTIIPTFNRAELLGQALQSVLAQTRLPDEIIVVDDGSSDHTAEVAAEYGSQVHYIKQDNKGVAVARNVGLREAQGDVVTWLDSDDLWQPDFLATMASALENKPKLDGVYCGFYHIDLGGEILSKVIRVVPADELYNRLIEGNFIVTPGLVMRKACYDVVGLFDTGLTIGEDADMWLRLARSFTISGIEAPLVKIRIHNQNSMVDTDIFSQSLLTRTEKHFGSFDDNAAAWTDEKRRGYAFAYRTLAFRNVEAGRPEIGWRYLEQAVDIMPSLLSRLDTFYELACGEQKRGYRGQASLMDINANGAEMLCYLDELFDGSRPELSAERDVAFGYA